MFTHKSVLSHEVLHNAYLPAGAVVVDGTLGLGGHAISFLNHKNDIAAYYGFDLDEKALTISKEKLIGYPCVHFVESNYSDAAKFLTNHGISAVDTIFLDLGVSSMQLDDSARGFSFRFDAPLNMRLDGSEIDTAKEYINTVDKEELIEVLVELGEEQYAKRIAEFIIEAREKKPIETTFELKDIVYRAYPVHKRFGRVHPATKTFQALRIVVNGELTSLIKALEELPPLLSPGGRMMVITFHSLEDRIVKHKFKTLAEEGKYKILTKKPIVPGEAELLDNPRARSSKLRIIEKTHE